MTHDDSCSGPNTRKTRSSGFQGACLDLLSKRNSKKDDNGLPINLTFLTLIYSGKNIYIFFNTTNATIVGEKKPKGGM